MNSKSVVVIGAGVMGTATARALARAGADVKLVEQFHIGHTRGSSHGSSRIYRLSYRDPMYVRMAQLAMPLWRELEEESGRQLFMRTGGLDAGPYIQENATALARCGVTAEIISGTEANDRYPMLSLDPEAEYLYQGDTGIVRATDSVAAFAEGARAAGADILGGRRVAAFAEDDGGVTLSTDAGDIRADRVVVTAGSWARKLLATADIDLPTRPTRESVAYFSIDGGAPPALVEWGDPTIYALPAPGYGLKVGEHIAGPDTDPDREGAVNEDSLTRVEEWVATRFARLAPVRVHAETCLYTNTADEHFILERRGRIVIGSPCSGHGFKFAPWIGQKLAELALEE